MPKKIDKKPKLTRKQKQLAATRSNCNDDEDGSSKSSRVKVERLETPVKGYFDKNEYRVIKLQNGLTALLIAHDSDDIAKERLNHPGSAKETKEPFVPSCHVCINVGSFSEHSRMAGESQLVPYLIRWGSKRYPNQKAGLISLYGCEKTALYCMLAGAPMTDILDRFAESFISPLMKRSEIIAKKKEIERMYEKACSTSVNTDRKKHLYSNLGYCFHPVLKFGERYLENLRQASEGNAYNEVMRFHRRHYSAHRMTAVLEADLPLDTLEDYVKQYFSRIPNNGLPPDDFSKFSHTDFYDGMSNFTKIYTMKPPEYSWKGKSLEVTWPMPPLEKHYRTKPHHYIQFVMDYEGEGSLKRYLERMRLCTSVYCQVGGDDYENNSIWSFFTLWIGLPEDGNANIVTILDAVYSYINLLRREGPQERIYNKIRKQAEVRFRFEKDIESTEYYQRVCQNMHLYRPSEYLTGSVLFFDYDPACIQDCLDLLTPDRANIIIYDPNFKEEEYYVADAEDRDDVSESDLIYFQRMYYTSIPIKDGWIRNWHNIQPFRQFRLP